MRIAVDAMGGSLGCPLAVSACQKVAERYPSVEFLLFGDASLLQPLLEPVTFLHSVQHCEEVIKDADKPTAIIRGKPRSSMHGAIIALSEGRAEAAISAGNTGAWLSLAAVYVGRIDGISRPALCSQIPSAETPRWMLDLGANPDCDAENLHQFALLGQALSVSMGCASPRVKLLNIGVEQSKGSALVQAAAQRLRSQTAIDYGGFVEADALFSDRVDVIVCDGFSGNIALKACEGTALFVMQLLAKNAPITASWQHLSALNPQSYNGAFFLGLKKTVVKAHGDSDLLGMTSAIEKAIIAASNQLISTIQHHL